MTARLPTLGALALLLALLACGWVSGVGLTLTDAQGDDTPTPYLVSTAMVGVFSDGHFEIIPPSPTPFPTWTPVPSATPVIAATNTPTPTSTPVIEPTQETTPPVPTPGPTVVPKQCTLRADGYNLRIRTGPGTGYTQTGLWSAGTERVFTEFAYDDFPTYLWGHHADGWSALYIVSTGDWYVDGTEGAQLCPDVIGWPEGLTPPAPIAAHNAALLWHTVPGFNIGNARVSYGILSDKGIDFGLKTYDSITACTEAAALGGICQYRHANEDCPQNIGGSDPRQSARDFFDAHAPLVCAILNDYPNTFYEPTNECNFGGPESDASLTIVYWWGEFMDEYLTRAQAHDCPPLILPTFGPGHGDPVQYRIWKPVLARLAASGGVMGEHAYTPGIEGGLCGCDEWLACRHRTNEEYRQAEGIDIDVAITEAARGWGNDPVSVSDFACWYEQVRGDEWLISVALWTAGYHPAWPNANLDQFMAPIAQAVR